MSERQAVQRPPNPGPVTASVVVPVWNVAPWLEQCLASVEEQTIGVAALELIAVDDGSTDGSGEMLDAFAATRPWVTVVHQANSGGPGAPRNAGIELARGRYLFFLDGDDYLAPDALERLVAMAERNRSDIVIGRVVGIEGRGERHRHAIYAEDRDRVAVEQVFRSGSIQKLFRASMLQGLRFQPGIAGGEDGDFMARAYLRAGTISIVGAEPCYFLRRREGSQTTRQDRRDDLVAYIERIEANRVRPAVASRRPGWRRDLLLAKPMAKLANKFWHAWPKRDPEERRRVFEAGAALAAQWHNPGVARRLPHRARLALYCLTHGQRAELEAITARGTREAYQQPVVEGRKVYAPLPHFRDDAAIPDACFDISGETPLDLRLQRAELADGRLELDGQAYIRLLGGTTTIELRRRPFGPVRRYPATPVPSHGVRDRGARYPRAGFRVSIDVGGSGGAWLPDGTWTIRARTEAGGVRRSRVVRLPGGHGADVLAERTARDGRAVLVAGPDRALRLRIGPPRSRVGERVEARLAAVARAARRLGRLGWRYALAFAVPG